MADEAPDDWEGLGPSTYMADGESELRVIARQITEKGGNRIVKHARPWQDGAKLDSTGAEPDDFTLELLFHPDVAEGDTEGDGQPAIWPDRLEALLKQFKTGKTATLHLPWKRNMRVKPTTWDRRAIGDDFRGGEILTASFCSDNEDDLDREAFEAVSVKSQVQRKAETTQFDMDSIGGWDGSIEDITQLAADLVGLMNTPGDYAAAIAHQAGRVMRAARFLTDSLTSAATGRGQLNDPEGSRARQGLLDLIEFAARAEMESRERLPKTVTVRYATDRSIYDIATERGQSVRDLIGVNSQIEDPAYIPANTPVLVFVG